MKRSAWVFWITCSLLALCQSGAAQTSDPFAEVRLIETALINPATGDRPPAPADPNWSSVALPHVQGPWRGLHDRVTAPAVWYRFQFDLKAGPQDFWAVYLPRIQERATLYVNGQQLTRTYRGGQGVEHGWNTPVYASIAPSLLHAGTNMVDLRLDSPYIGRTEISALRIGPEALVHDQWEWRYGIQITLVQIITSLLALLGLFALGIWSMQRRESLYLYLGLGAICLTVRNLHYTVRHLPDLVDWFWWGTVNSLGWVMLFITYFALRFYGMRMPRLERALAIGVLAVALLTVPPIGVDVGTAAPWIYAAMAPIAACVTGLFVAKAIRRPGPPQIMLVLAMMFTLGFGVHDLLLLTARISIENMYLLPYAAAVLAVAFAFALAGRHVQSLARVENLNSELEIRVNARTSELALTYGRLSEIDNQRLLAEERQRLMREIHDGIGSNLITSLAMLESGLQTADSVRAAEVLRDAIADLKLTVDSLEPIDHDLIALLANFRFRIEPRLAGANIQLIWQVNDLPPLTWLDPPRALHVLRILQEAFSNVVHHAQATHLRLQTRVLTASDGGNTHVEVAIEDDGQGFDVDVARKGKGLRNMRKRAQALGGTLHIRSATGATRIILRLPIVMQELRTDSDDSG